MTKAEVLARLNERRERIAAFPVETHSRSTKDAVRRTLGALDHPFSHYVVLSSEEREHVRASWLALASSMGISPAKSKSKKPKLAPAMPPQVLEFFGDTSSLPHRPRATDDYNNGSQRVSWAQALHMRSVDLNPPAHVHWLVFDCDHVESARWKTVGLPEPSFVTVNPSNGNHHVAYRLNAPVCRSEHARHHPLAYLRAVQKALRHALKGDQSYAGTMTKNPLHPAWVTIRSTQMPSYDLAELASAVGLQTTAAASTHKQRPRQVSTPDLAEVGVGGRNRALFDAVRTWAYSHPEERQNIHSTAEQCNLLFAEPLTALEVRGIAKSIERYLGTSRQHSRTHAAFRARQASRGRRGGRPITTQASQPWSAEGVSRSTWYLRQKSAQTPALRDDSSQQCKQRVGRPITTKLNRPWESAGISRSTWYRHCKFQAAP